MAVRKQRATTSKEIMETDIHVAIKKAKVRFRKEEQFYILKYEISEGVTYFATGSPDIIRETGEESYYEKWIFDNKWIKIS